MDPPYASPFRFPPAHVPSPRLLHDDRPRPRPRHLFPFPRDSDRDRDLFPSHYHQFPHLPPSPSSAFSFPLPPSPSPHHPLHHHHLPYHRPHLLDDSFGPGPSMSFSPPEFHPPPDRDRRPKRSLEPCANMGNLRHHFLDDSFGAGPSMSFPPPEFHPPPDRDRRPKRSLEPCANMGNLRHHLLDDSFGPGPSMSFSPPEFHPPPDRDRRPKRSLEPFANMGNLRHQRRRFRDDFSAFERGPVAGEGDHVFRRSVKDRIFRPPVKKRLAKVTGIHSGNPNRRRKEGNLGEVKPQASKVDVSEKSEAALIGSGNSVACPSRTMAKKLKIEKAKVLLSSIMRKSMVVVADKGEDEKVLHPCPDERASPSIETSNTKSHNDNDAKVTNSDVVAEGSSLNQNSSVEQVKLGESAKKKKRRKKKIKMFRSPNKLKCVVFGAVKGKTEKVLNSCSDEKASPLIQRSTTNLHTRNGEKVMNSDAGEVVSTSNHKLGMQLDQLGKVAKKRKNKKVKVLLSSDKLKLTAIGAGIGEADKVLNPCSGEAASSLIQRTNVKLGPDNDDKMTNAVANEEPSPLNYNSRTELVELGECVRSVTDSGQTDEKVDVVLREGEAVEREGPTEAVAVRELHINWAEQSGEGKLPCYILLSPQSSPSEVVEGNKCGLTGREEASEYNLLTDFVELGELVRPVTDSGKTNEKIDVVVREEVVEREGPTEAVALSELHTNGAEQSGEGKLPVDILISSHSSPSEAVEGNKCGSTGIEEASEYLAKYSCKQEAELFADGLLGIKCPGALQVVTEGDFSIMSSPGAKDSNILELDVLQSDSNERMASIPGTGLNTGEQNMIDPLITVAAPSNSDTGTVSIPEADKTTDEFMVMDRKRPDKVVLPPLPPSRQSAVGSAISKASSSRGIASTFPKMASFSFGDLKQKVFVSKDQFVKRARTWHREGNSHSSPSPSPVRESCLTSTLLKETPGACQSQMESYIRKGNSLVRKASAVNALPQAKSRTICGEERREVLEAEGSASHLLERPKTPPLFNNTKFQKCASKGLELNSNKAVVPTGFLGDSSTNFSICKSEDQNYLKGEELKMPTEMKRVTYVRRKSNQLVAAPRKEVSNPVEDKAQELPTTFPADVYYKSKKNQIVRNVAALENNKKLEQSSNLDGQKVTFMLPSIKYGRSFSKRKLAKVLERPSKFSFVWTLSKDRSDNKDKTTASLQYSKVLPYLFPWKRPIYFRHSSKNLVADSDKQSLSVISRKLQLLRKRDTLYTKSKNGFSIRKSRVLSIGGSGLKWSNSIERRSKKASKEATLAVAAAQKKKKEQKGVALAVGKLKNSGHLSRKSACGLELLPGERIFRVGSVRYKMDASNKTLIRISDEKSPSEVDDAQSGIATKKTYIPRRLVIGNDEYVRVGNGNKLVRDPKRLKRILASEKIRWSLHNARLRRAKKQQYCQFFTRFGKCNKENGKCPYIHDPDKIAVCTRFLRGLCSGTNCKLTHKVIPERMPDCSYFLRGLCTNEYCPYRHVNVNPNASVCEGFLRGYCADGDECHKKHTYLCPFIETNGTCSQGPTCKLHHPKSVIRSKKRKRGDEQKNINGRYFGSSELIDGVESEVSFANDQSVAAAGEDIFCHDGRYKDYISLDISEEEEETKDPTEMRLMSCKSEPSELLLDDLDKLIKPVRIMMNQTTLWKTNVAISSRESLLYNRLCQHGAMVRGMSFCDLSHQS